MSAYCSSRMDYWYVFACLGMDVLKPGGVMHLVVPNKWMANAGAVPLRRKLLEECGALRLSDFEPAGCLSPPGFTPWRFWRKGKNRG